MHATLRKDIWWYKFKKRRSGSYRKRKIVESGSYPPSAGVRLLDTNTIFHSACRVVSNGSRANRLRPHYPGKMVDGWRQRQSAKEFSKFFFCSFPPNHHQDHHLYLHWNRGTRPLTLWINHYKLLNIEVFMNFKIKKDIVIGNVTQETTSQLLKNILLNRKSL